MSIVKALSVPGLGKHLRDKIVMHRLKHMFAHIDKYVERTRLDKGLEEHIINHPNLVKHMRVDGLTTEQIKDRIKNKIA